MDIIRTRWIRLEDKVAKQKLSVAKGAAVVTSEASVLSRGAWGSIPQNKQAQILWQASNMPFTDSYTSNPVYLAIEWSDGLLNQRIHRDVMFKHL